MIPECVHGPPLACDSAPVIHVASLTDEDTLKL